MYWESIYWWPMVWAGLIGLGVCFYVWPRRRSSGAKLFMGMMLGVSVWSLSYALEHGGLTYSLKIIGLKLEYLGIVSVPPLWLAFALSYTGRNRLLARKYIIAPILLSLVTLLLTWTNEYHHLVYARVLVLEVAPYLRITFERGPWFWVWVVIGYLQMAAGSVILIAAMLRSSRIYRKQLGIVLLGAAFPWISNAVYLGDFLGIPYLDPTPFAFTLTGLFWAWGLFRLRLMDLEPIARQVVIDGLSEAVFVLDNLDRLVDANSSAARLMGLKTSQALGSKLQTLIPELAEHIREGKPSTELVVRIGSGEEDKEHWYETRISELTDERKRPLGRVVIMYDISQRQETERALKNSEERYRLVVENSQVGIIIVDHKYTIIYSNPEFARISGRPREEIEGHDYREFIAEESRELVNTRYRERQEGLSPPSHYTIRVSRPDGTKRVTDLSSAVIHHAETGVQTVAQLMDVTEQEQAATALRESEKRYRTVFEQSRDVIYISGPDSEVIEFNPAATELLGYTLEEYKRLESSQHYVDPGQRTDQLAKLHRDGYVRDYEIKLRRKDGSEIICLDTTTVWRDENGVVKGYIGTLRDVTESKRAEQALRESEERYQRILEASQDPMVLYDMEGKVIYLNPSFTRTFGWTLEELKGKRIDFVPRENRPETKRMVDLVRQGKSFSGFETRRYTKSGRTMDVSISAAVFRDRHGNPMGSVINLRDETRRKEAEEAVRESEEKFRNITANALDGIIMIDPGGIISFWNEAAESIFGYSEKEALGRDLHLLLAPAKYNPLYVEAFRNYKINGKGGAVGRTLELTALKKNGEEFPVEISISSLRLHDQWHAIGIVRDISERKQAEEERERLEAQLRQAQKMEAVGTLASGVAHDFNNLLQGISGYAQLILTNEEKATLYAGEIDKAAQRATDLVTGLLTFGRKVEPKLKPLDLNEVVLQSVRFLERTIPRMVLIETDLAGDQIFISADANQLNQVLMNLGANARDAMPEGGKLLFSTRGVSLAQSPAGDGLLAPGEYVRLTISDNGTGMSESVRKHIFEPFFTTKGVGKGSGLGLSMVYGIVNNHGGHITCDSGLGQGTTFTIHFPALAVDRVRPTPGGGTEEEFPGGDETVLVVDDEVTIQEMAREILSQRGYRVLIASSGEEALEGYRTGDRPDLVLMDLSMPGMGGRKALVELLKLDPSLKIIISSGYTSRQQVEECLRTGARDFIAKPYRMASLLKGIRSVLDG